MILEHHRLQFLMPFPRQSLSFQRPAHRLKPGYFLFVAEALEFGPKTDKELFWKDSILAPHFVRRKVIVKSTGRLFTGWTKDMYDDGQIERLVQYKDGLKEGIWIEWYPTGKRRSESNFKGGKQDGFWTYWYENGQKKSEHTYKDGEIVED